MADPAAHLVDHVLPVRPVSPVGAAPAWVAAFALHLAQVQRRVAVSELRIDNRGLYQCVVRASLQSLNLTVQLSFNSAVQYIELARTAANQADRVQAANSARQLPVSASSSIGTNLTYQIGQGVAMF